MSMNKKEYKQPTAKISCCVGSQIVCSSNGLNVNGRKDVGWDGNRYFDDEEEDR